MFDFPDDATEFQLCWTSKASEVTVWASARTQAEERAGAAFIRKQDQVAEAMRSLAALFDGFHRTTLSELNQYIAEDNRREAEFRQKMKASRPKLKIEREARP